MKKILQTMLISAIFATSGMAYTSTISGEYNDKLIIQGTTVAEVPASGAGFHSDLELKDTASLTNNGTIEASGELSIEAGASLTNNEQINMGKNSFINSTGIFTNAGVVNMSYITDFSKFIGKITSADNVTIVDISGKITSTSSGLIIKGPENSDVGCSLNYDGGNYELFTEDGLGEIQVVGNSLTNLDYITNKTGIGFENGNNINVANYGADDFMTFQRMCDDTAANIADNSDKSFLLDTYADAFDIENKVLTETLATGGKICFPVSVESGTLSELNLTGSGNLTFAEDCSGFQAKITTEGGVEFQNQPSTGGLDIGGDLIVNDSSKNIETFNFSSASINVGNLVVKDGTNVTFYGVVTIGKAAVV